MRSRTFALFVLFFGGVSLFLLGLVAAPLLGLVTPQNFAGHPAATISLDLSGQVAALQEEKNRLSAALVQSARDAAALEKRLAESPPAAASGDNAPSRRQLAAVSSERDKALAQSKAIAAHAQSLKSERDAARQELAAAQGAIGALQRDLATAESSRATSVEAATSEFARLRATLAERTAEIATLRRHAEASDAALAAQTAPPRVESAPPARSSTVAPRGSEAPLANATSAIAAGVTAYLAGQYQKAYAIWYPVAEAGDARAQFHVGALYYEGRGVERDFVESRRWLDQAVANGSKSAAALLNAIADASDQSGRR